MAVFINLIALAALLISIFCSQTKTKQGIKKALIKALGLAPQMLIIITAIGLVFAFLRFIFTLISVVLMGLIIERLVDEKTL
ncbi:hypothetical protein DFR79_10338 [Halanaerobium saccharolyticum]|uniref:Uncharacterized protein n=1 Tax=Halanaerobium saccharolyticum TaxID=43595 RepID=A0A4R6M1V8_9FIRM|nr:hypothetical protein [Halanaerobium saccharolyticum]TDO94360.1 hypothetical protein DFR79_10338 [Halanaerobium saccharolyticum]